MSPFTRDQADRLSTFCTHLYDADIAHGLMDLPYSGKDVKDILTKTEFPDIIESYLRREISSPVAIYLAGREIHS